MKDIKDISIIITCYNEQRMLVPAIEKLKNIFEMTKLDYEIVIVDDYSTDGSRDLIKKLDEEDSRIRATFHEKNRGRGRSVADGVKFAKGIVVGFNDMDFSTDPVYILKLYNKIIKEDYDIATADRIYKLKGLNLTILKRYSMHLGYKFLVKHALKTTLSDTETGCKFFRRSALLMYIDEIKDEHWFWDTEVMVRGYFHGLKIVEVPTLFVRRPDLGTTVKAVRDTKRHFLSLLKFRKEMKETMKNFKKN